jgi:hypothetical protein
MLKVTGTLAAVMMLLASMLPGQNNARRSRADSEKKSSTSFATRDQNVVRSGDEPMHEEKLTARPIRTIAPNAPTVCRHDDLNRDIEFRMCMNQLLDSSGRLQRTNRGQAAD